MEKRAFYWMSMAVFVCAISMMFARPGGKTIPMPSLLKTGCSWTAVSISGYDREYRILDGVDLLRRAGIEVINLPISEEGEKKDE